MSYTVPDQLLESIRSSDRVLCVSHVAPDGDAYGSLLGACWLLRALGKTPTPAMHDPLLEEFRFLPGAETICAPEAVGEDFDLILCLDASSPDRMGAVYQAEKHAGLPLAMIDHHITNTNFGSVNWVEGTCAAACQMIAYLALALDVPLSGPLAVCLLTGVVTDTLCFRTSNTTPEVLEVAMQLQRGGASLSDIVQRTLNRMPYSMLRLWGQTLPGAHLEDGVVWVTVSRSQAEAAGQLSGDSKLSGVLSTVSEADVSAVFTEKIGKTGQPAVECSFRARPGFNVGELAFAYGGGGHAPASGCTLEGTLDDVVARVVPALKATRRRQAGLAT